MLKVGKLSAYEIQLKTLSEGVHLFEYELDNVFFEKIDSPEIQKGKLSAVLLLKRTDRIFELQFALDGVVTVSCDRCLDEVQQPVSCREKLYVKFGSDFSQEEDNIVIVPEHEGSINIAWFLYEFIALNVPAKHVHKVGECNKSMYSQLKKHLITDRGDEDDFSGEAFGDDKANEPTDPRWDELKKIIL
jgi:uncharacterized metal-binding protein YceD (DUF177 family)